MLEANHKKTNEMEYKQNQILGSMTSAWTSLDTLRQFRTKNEMKYEQNLIL